ncbi:MAG: hypothetical protein RI556_09570, partial [Hydrogenovibrio sp.]|uniref:hypothetical protein n=1 Tax=Hydrogenovibrio sp. TaxID=2065821 RepID=UPI0028706C36
MRLPDTENAHELYAFKKGYRTAKSGLSQSSMPSQIRYDQTLREFFQAGFEAYETDLAETLLAGKQRPWRQRLAWWVMMALAGIATASLMVHNIETDQPVDTLAKKPSAEPETRAPEAATPKVPSQPDMSLLANQTLSEQPPVSKNDTDVETDQASPPEQEKTELSLISDQAREDLMARKQDYADLRANDAPIPAVVSSPIKTKRMQLTREVQQMEPAERLRSPIPKYVRQVTFFTEIEGAKGQTLSHHWYYQNR